MLVPVRTHRRHCKTVPRKIFGSSGGSFLPTGATPVGYAPRATAFNQEWMIAELLYRRLLSSSGETQSSVVLAML